MNQLLNLCVSLMIFASVGFTVHSFARSNLHNFWFKVLTVVFIIIWCITGALYFAMFLRQEFRLSQIYVAGDYFRVFFIPVCSVIYSMGLRTVRRSQIDEQAG